ncbi:uncharacterized protein LOC135371418 isoform X2 [Ornithodoros turicata]|uniref:uncharacterized protein LOC135371418 isoform X2 n=1 Tax=Ornithodoros turicata TaxID=34597 RepID=UPI0031393217
MSCLLSMLFLSCRLFCVCLHSSPPSVTQFVRALQCTLLRITVTFTYNDPASLCFDQGNDIFIFTRDGSIPVYPPGPYTGTTSTPENDDLSQSHATTTTSEHGDLSTSHGEPDLRTTNSKNGTSDTSSSFSTTSTSSSTTSTSTTTTSMKPPPPTSAPYKPGDFLLCSITSGMADHLPKDGLCNIIFFTLLTTNTSVMFSSNSVIAFNRIRRYVAASRRTQCGLDFEFNTIGEHRNNIGSSSTLQAITEIGAPLSGVLAAKVGSNWDERSEATSVLLHEDAWQLLQAASASLEPTAKTFMSFTPAVALYDLEKGIHVDPPCRSVEYSDFRSWCKEKRVRVTDYVYSLAWDGFTVKVADDLGTTKQKVCAARSTGFQGHWAVFALERADNYSCGHSKLSYTDILRKMDQCSRTKKKYNDPNPY